MRSADFARITRSGRRISTLNFLLFVLPRADVGSPRLGLTVTRKVGHAVRRNRIKRLVREWFRQRAPDVPFDLVVIAKREIPSRITFQDVREDLDTALDAFPAPA